jgi:hypothetical protein
LLIILFVMDRDDIRIFKEILGLKNPS